MIQCKLCQHECKSWGSLNKHLLYNHPGYSTQKYYDTFLKNPNSGICQICQVATNFVSIGKGYHRTCGHKCACTLHRKELVADKDRHDKFIEKLSEHQALVWEEREKTGEKEKILKKISNTATDNYQLMTEEERSQRCGWMNKLTEQEKEKWIADVMMNTGAHLWWREGNEEDRQAVIEQRNATKLGITVEEYKSCQYIDDDRERYYTQVWRITEQTYQKYKHEIDPDNLRSPEYHLDHKYSIIRGYYEGIDPEVVGSKYNLEILSRTLNSAKSGKCSISIDHLKECYNG